MDNTISERKARYMKDKKTLSVGIDKDLYNALEDIVKDKNTTKRYIIETLLYKYINGDIEISDT